MQRYKQHLNKHINITKILLKMDILNYYNGLERTEKRKFRDDVMEITGLQYFTFNRKLKSNGWTKLEREAINHHISYGMGKS